MDEHQFQYLDELKANLREIAELNKAVDRNIEASDHPTTSTPHRSPMSDLSRQEVDAKLAANKAEVDARLANFDTSIKTGFAEARVEMSELRADVHKMHAEIKTWTLATMITIIGTMLAAIFGVATIFNNASKPAAAPQPGQPMVIYSQPAPQPPAPTQPKAQ